MKTTYNLLVLIGLLSYPFSLSAQSAAFTYQGKLTTTGQPANGSYDLAFALFKDSTGGSAAAEPLAYGPVAISNGLFTIVLDFGAGIFNGTSYWLEIAVRIHGVGAFTTLSPRQALTPSPYAVYAQGADAVGLKGTIPTSSLSGLYDQPVILNHPNNSFSGDGSGLTGVDAATLQGITAGQLLTSLEDGSGLINLSPWNISPGTASIDIAGNAVTADYANYTGIASNAPGSPFALVVKGDQTNEGGIYIKNANGLAAGGIRLGTDGGITTGGYLSLCNNTGIYAIPAARQAMMGIGCDVPNGIVGYCGSPFLTLFDQVEGGLAISGNFVNGCNTFTIGAYGQVVLNNPLSQSWDIYEPKFESPQLVFQSEVLTNSGKWGPTNYWGISQLSNVFTIGPMIGIKLHTNWSGQTVSYVEGSVLPAIAITTNGNVGIGTANPKHILEVAGAVSATSFMWGSNTSALGSEVGGLSIGGGSATISPAGAAAFASLTVGGLTPITGNQTITLSGDVTGSGATSIAATCALNPGTFAGNTANSTIPANTTQYYAPNGNFPTNAQSSDIALFTRLMVPTQVKLCNLWVRASAAQGNGKTLTVTVMTNGVASKIVASLLNTTIGSDTSNTEIVAAGTEIGIKVVTPSGGSATKVSWALGFR